MENTPTYLVQATMDAVQWKEGGDWGADTKPTLTENGAVAQATTGSKALDFFTLPTRNYDSTNLIKLFDDSFNEDPFKSLQILFHLRDPRNGKGEKELTLKLLEHMVENYPRNFQANIQALTAEYGCYKMLCELYARDYAKRKKSASMKPLKVLADALGEGLPLAAKWAPSEHGHFNHKKEGYQVTKLCQLLGLVRKNKDDETRPDYQAYRKLISPLRTKANIVEQLCCSNRWEDIEFSRVAARAMQILSKKAFPSHCTDKFNEWKQAVAEGKAEIKTSGLHPHEIIKSVMSGETTDTQELQWKQMVANVKSLGTLKNALAMSDVSGSMYNGAKPQPIEVSLALGIFISELAQGKFNKKILSFSTDSKIVEVKGSTLAEKINSVTTECMGYSTNYVGALRSVLEYGKLFQISQEMMPSAIFVLTDMEFDAADDGKNKTPHEVVRDEYMAAGYILPKIIFWNLACRSNALPVTIRDENTALVSGFSQTLLKAFMELDPEKAFDPITVMNSILKDYKPQVCDEQKCT
jgi:hypothetical protein